ncbi:MAG TPA: DUF998 domain-containing protein [Mucilaginibacter sp.]|jgi:hypothetical membrane protein|nr:DUF998 domain-containing protein [Mucilaginibacter sp.]
MEQPPATAVLRRNIPLHILLICWGVSGSLIFNVVYFSFGMLTPNYDELSQPIGRLELAPHGWIQSLNFLILGLFTGIFAIGLRRELAGGFGAAVLPAFHFVTAFGLVLMGVFIHEPAHTYVSFLTFFSIQFSFLVFARLFWRDERWPGWTRFTNICAFLITALMLIFWYARGWEADYAGLFERLLEIIRLVWYVAFALKLLYSRQISAEV